MRLKHKEMKILITGSLGLIAKEAFSVNVMGTLNLVEAAKKSGVKKFIYASSIWVYGLPSEGTLPE